MTIKDIARVVGVHFATVSKALRGHRRIPAATRARILAAASRLGYRRDPVFLALAQRRWPKLTARIARPRVAFLVNRSPEEGFGQLSFYHQFLKGARSQAEALGYDLEVQFVDRGYHDSRSLELYLKREGITGIIIGAFEASRRTLVLDWSKYCGVKIDSRFMPPAYTFVSNDQMHYTRVAFRKLRSLGFRRVGLAVSADGELMTDDMHLCSYHFEQQALPYSEQVSPMLFPPGAKMREISSLLASWIQREAVDAVISNWTHIRSLIRGGGIDCPGSVACACMCMAHPFDGLAGMVANLQLVGRQAVALLAALMRGERYGVPTAATSTYVQGFWRDGASAPSRVGRTR